MRIILRWLDAGTQYGIDSTQVSIHPDSKYQEALARRIPIVKPSYLEAVWGNQAAGGTFSILEWSSWCKLFLRQIQEVGMDRMTQWLFERKAQVHVIVLVAGLWWLVHCGYRGCTICCLWLDWQFALTQTAVEIPRFVWREWAFQSIQTALLPALSFHQNPEHSDPGLWNVTHVAPHQSMFSWGDEWLV